MRHWIGVAFLLASLDGASAQQYVITTVAGGVPLPTPAAAAQSAAPLPTALTLDSAGNVYFAGESCIFKITPGGVMTRIAGNARTGYSGDGGPATNAQLGNPTGMAVDTAGNLYLADGLNNRVRKVSTDGTISTVAGNGAAGYSGDGSAAVNAQLNGPSGVALDSAGNLYIADTGNHRVRKVSAKDGTISTVVGTGVAGYSGDGGSPLSAQLHSPLYAGLDGAGAIYIADSGNYAIRKVANGVISTIAGNGKIGVGPGDNAVPAAGVSFGPIASMAVDTKGDVYVGDGVWKIWKVSNGTLSDLPPGWFAGSIQATGLAVDAAGNLYVAENYFGSIQVASPTGKVTYLTLQYPVAPDLGDGGPATSAYLKGPHGISLDSSGAIYIADAGNSYGYIRKVAKDGIISTVVGGSQNWGPGAPALDSLLQQPSSVALDAKGNLFVIEYWGVYEVPQATGLVTIAGTGLGLYYCPIVNYVWQQLAFDGAGNLYATSPIGVYKMTPDGHWTTIAGNGHYGFTGDGSALGVAFQYATGIAADSAGNLYVADTFNQRIRKVTPLGVLTTIAGNGTAGFKGDGGPATSAELNQPLGVAVDSAGNLYIADTLNNRIRKVTANGTITTIAGTGFPAYMGDGGLATQADLNGPFGIQVDKAGNLYFSDQGNRAVRMLSVVGPLAVSAATLPNGVVGSVYSASLSATGGVQPYAWTLSSGSMPAGLTLSRNGVISGTPAAAGTSTFTVTVTDGQSSSSAQVFQIQVMAALAVNAGALPSGIAGAGYSQNLSAAGGTPPYGWSVSGGSLPAGLTLSAAGVISGIPTTAGTFGFAVTVTDSGSLTAAQTFSIQVFNAAPVIGPATALAVGVTGAAYSQTLSAAGGNPPCIWSISSGALPAGLTLSAAGVISGIPTSAGTYGFAATITDSASLTATQVISVTILDAGSLSRSGVLAYVPAGSGWTTNIALGNSTANPIGAVVILHANDGSVVWSQAAVVAANGALAQPIGNAALSAAGWLELLSSGAASASVGFAMNGNAQGAPVPLEGRFESEVDAAYDNTGSSATAVALVNLSGNAAATIATILDANGEQLDQEPVTIPANGQVVIALAAQFAATVGQAGTVKFQNPAGGNLAGLILQIGPDGSLVASQAYLP
jgi:sugar lactone lactonase YvrE